MKFEENFKENSASKFEGKIDVRTERFKSHD